MVIYKGIKIEERFFCLFCFVLLLLEYSADAFTLDYCLAIFKR